MAKKTRKKFSPKFSPQRHVTCLSQCFSKLAVWLSFVLLPLNVCNCWFSWTLFFSVFFFVWNYTHEMYKWENSIRCDGCREASEREGDGNHAKSRFNLFLVAKKISFFIHRSFLWCLTTKMLIGWQLRVLFLGRP